MKVVSTIATAVIALLSIASPVTAQGTVYDDFSGNFSDGFLKRSLLVVGNTTRKATKTYTTGVRSTEGGGNFCGGSLITPTHVLTASHCVSHYIRWVSIGSHYINGTQDGEQIRVVSIVNHPNYWERARFSDDFVILELEKPSSFRPIKLAAADDSDFKEGELVTATGWGQTGQNETQTYELKQAQFQLWNDEKCSMTLANRNPIYVVDDTMVCAGGKSGESACFGDSGGPLIKESSTGEDVLIGVVSWGDGCGRANSPTVFGRVSRVRSWIESFSNGTCFEKH